jgi:arylsulfatase A-like enzyme
MRRIAAVAGALAAWGARLPPVARDVGLGVFAFVVFFLVDAGESWHHVQNALRRVRADETGNAALVRAVAGYIAGTAVGYVLVGLVAGAALHAWARVTRPRRPWLAGVATLAVAIALGVARHAVVQPGLYQGLPYRAWWASNVHPDWVAGAMAACVAGGLVLGLRRAPSVGAWLASLLPLAAIAGAVALLWRVPVAPVPAKNAGPNVILLGFDALRPDHLGFNGYPRGITPNLDRFLAESTVWDTAFTPLARTAPAWMTLLSGTFPQTHDVRDPLPDPDRLVPKVPLLPQVLKEKGFHTTFATDDSRFSYMVPEHGFDAILQPPVDVANFAVAGSEPRFRAFYGLLDNPLGWALVPTIRMNQAFGRSYRPDRWNSAVDRALADAATHDRAFFAVHDCTLHAPADRFWPYTWLFDQRDYGGRNRFRYVSMGSAALGETPDRGPAAVAQDTNLYDAGLVMVDARFGEIRRRLEASGLWENSIVVLLSDHGEELDGEVDRYDFVGPNHGWHPWGQSQYRVLLAVHWPASMARPPSRETNLASLADVAPTVAEALGFAWEGDGRSLFDASPRILPIETGLSEPGYWEKDLPGHRGYPFESASRSYTVEEATGRVYAKPELRDAVIRAKDRVVLDERWKLVWYPLTDGYRLDLFDWRADPNDTTDLDAARPDVVARLWPALRAELLRDGIDAPEIPTFGPAIVAEETP